MKRSSLSGFHLEIRTQEKRKDKHFEFPDWVRDGEVKKTSSLKIKAAKEYVKRSDNDFDKYLVLTSKDLFDDKSFKIFNLERLKKTLLQENDNHKTNF